jgi:hypothetical protein
VRKAWILRRRQCPFCLQTILESTYPEHMKICFIHGPMPVALSAPMRQSMSGSSLHPCGWSNGVFVPGPVDPQALGSNGGPIFFTIGGLNDDVQHQLNKAISIGSQVWSEKTTRPTQQGLLHAFGWCERWNQMYKGSDDFLFQYEVETLYTLALQSPAVEVMLHYAANPEFRAAYPNAVPFQCPMGSVFPKKGSMNVFFGIDFLAMSMPLEGDDPHSPPPQIAQHLKVPPCTETCLICSTHGCLYCQWCCLHKDKGDKGGTILIEKQSPRPLVKNQAWFVVGNSAFPLQSGFVCCFDGRSTPHGVWAPKDAEVNTTWKGCAFVNRS